MLESLMNLNAEVVAGGIVGFVMLGVVIRNVIIGWREAMRTTQTARPAAMTQAFAVSWDRDQIERALQTLERIAEGISMNAKASEGISRAQAILADQFQQSTQEKLEHILERLDEAERNRQASRPVRRRV